jgi:plasmid stabilization system protein ParE
VASVIVMPTAERNLNDLIESHSLPESTPERFRQSTEPLRRFPLVGAPLGGRWAGLRFILGPWRWMIVVYRYREERDAVEIITIRDARSARAPRSSG